MPPLAAVDPSAVARDNEHRCFLLVTRVSVCAGTQRRANRILHGEEAAGDDNGGRGS